MPEPYGSSSDVPNPYAVTGDITQPQVGDYGISSGDQRKIDAVIKDAGQFWLAMLICILCSGIGSLIVPLWYSVRLMQWKGFATKYPALVTSDDDPGSLPSKFRSSQWKLIVGLVFGIFMLCMLILFVVVSSLL